MKPSLYLIGDSITEWGADRSGWVDLLQKLAGASVAVTNRGRGGWSTRFVAPGRLFVVAGLIDSWLCVSAGISSVRWPKTKRN